MEDDAGAFGDRDEGVFGDVDRQARVLRDQLVQTAQLAGAAREHDAAVHQVRRELRRAALQRDADGLDDGRHRLLQRLAHLVRGDRQRLGQAGDQVAALDLVAHLLPEGVGRADGNLDFLGGAFADHEVVDALEVLDDGLVHLVAAHAHAAADDDAGQRDDGHLGRAAAHVHDHVAGGLLDGQADADGGRHGLLDEVHLAGAGGLGGVAHGALLHLGDPAGDRDDDARADDPAAVVGLADEVAEHGFRHFEIGDDAGLHGADGDDVAGSAAEHALGLLADGEHAVGALLDGHDGGLAEHDAAVLDVDQGVGGTQIDADIVGKMT